MVLLLGSIAAWLTPPTEAGGHFVLAAKLAGASAFVSKTLDTPWLGPGLIVAVVLVLTLRGARRVGGKPLRRIFRVPKLERYRGEIPRRHQDLEI